MPPNLQFRNGRVFPAPAGINRHLRRKSLLTTSVPRASGDKPLRLQEETYIEHVFPAPAGINRARPAGIAPRSRVPRASGDKP
ncbi:hypothetical protein I2518_003437 [Escherichia coli]|nr:hypothetical protein [Escherichia coli]